MLESEIKRLSGNIEHLNKLLEAMADAAKEARKVDTAVAPEAKAEKPVEEALVEKPVEEAPVEKSVEEAPMEKSVEEAFTHTAVKGLALSIAKIDRAQRDNIKDKLSEFGAKVVTDLSSEDTQTVGAWMTDLHEGLSK